MSLRELWAHVNARNRQTVVWEFIINYRGRISERPVQEDEQLEGGVQNDSMETIIITNASYRIIGALSKSQFELNRLSYPSTPSLASCLVFHLNLRIYGLGFFSFLFQLILLLLLLLLLHLLLSFKSIMFSSPHTVLSAWFPPLFTCHVTFYYAMIFANWVRLKKYSG